MLKYPQYKNKVFIRIYQNMATIISQTEKEKLYTQVFHLLGMPVRGVELTEEQMDTFMELSLSEYEQYVSDWLIESQWSALAGLDVDTQSLTRAFTTRSLDYETQYTYSYSKIVGLQAGGPHELKKDYISLTGGTQTYEIPAGPLYKWTNFLPSGPAVILYVKSPPINLFFIFLSCILNSKSNAGNIK